MEILASARKHGVGDEDRLWAIDHALATADVETDFAGAINGIIHIGPSRAGHLLEVVTIVTDGGDELVIHAMRARRSLVRRLQAGDA